MHICTLTQNLPSGRCRLLLACSAAFTSQELCKVWARQYFDSALTFVARNSFFQLSVQLPLSLLRIDEVNFLCSSNLALVLWLCLLKCKFTPFWTVLFCSFFPKYMSAGIVYWQSQTLQCASWGAEVICIQDSIHCSKVSANTDRKKIVPAANVVSLPVKCLWFYGIMLVKFQ